MSMKIEIRVTIEKEETGLHLLACPKHQDDLADELEMVIARLVDDGVDEVGVAQLGTISIGDLDYDEHQIRRVKLKSAEEMLAAIKESVGKQGVLIIGGKQSESTESPLENAPDEAFLHPRSA